MDDWHEAWSDRSATGETLNVWRHGDSDERARRWGDLPDWPGDDKAGAGTHIVITDTVVEAERPAAA